MTAEMRVLAVAQAFKGTMSVSEVAGALEGGIRAAGAEPQVVWASDGGDGLLEALGGDLASRTSHSVTGPLGALVDVPAGWLDEGTAVIESRLVCGLSLVPAPSRDPFRTTTRGLGELIREVVNAGAKTVLIGLGGSATVDGGTGMARAWEFVPQDVRGRDLPEGGGALADVVRFRDGQAPAARLIGLTDVRNPLVGDRGARVYAAQKGATPAGVERLSLGLDRLAAIASEAGRGEQSRAPGAGAAGGLGFGILFFGGGTLVGGADWFLDRLRFSECLLHAHLVLAGEGAFDATSLEGKLTGQVLAAASRAGVPAALLAPRADHVPPGVVLETGSDGGEWNADELARRVRTVVERALRSARPR